MSVQGHIGAAARLRTLFDAIVDLDELERQCELERIAQTDPDTARQLTRLLYADEHCKTGDLPLPVSPVEPPVDFGPYLIREALGEGGMGSVYLAEQVEPVRRTVALKLIREDLTHGDLHNRFAVEQQALAALSHPLIAQFYDAGTTPGGDPYFAMEYVPGLNIDEYCEANRLSIRQRVSLFIQVCVAVQFAHGKGMIHRDIKPPNILVTMVSDRPLVKVIDFGIARIVDEESSDSSGRPQHILGTPDYMAPEQLAINVSGEVVDTRTDVYALGVILYRLLTGRTPYGFGRRGLSMIHVGQELARHDPLSPSAVLNEDFARQTLNRFGSRGTSRSRVERIYRDELDWIVLKALHRDPDQRYGSAEALGEDLKRFLKNEPVHARPTSRVYRLRKLALRNKTPTAIVTMAFAGAIAVAVTATIQARRIAAEAAVSEQVLEMMSSAFSAADPEIAQGEVVTARDVVDRATAGLQALASDHPARPRLSRELGWIYFNLGDYDAATRLLGEALAGYREQAGPEARETLDTLSNLAHAYRMDSRLEEAEDAFKQALAMHRRLDGVDHEQTLKAIGDLSTIYLARYESERALPLLEEGYRLTREKLGETNLTTLKFGANLALSYAREGQGGDYQKGVDLLVELIPQFQTAKGEDHPNVLGLSFNLAVWYKSLDQLDRSREVIENIIPRMKNVLGDSHPLTLSALEHHADLASQVGQHAEAAGLMEPIYAQRLAVQGAKDISTLRTGHNLALYMLSGQLDPEATIALFEDVLAGFRELVGDENFLSQQAAMNLAQALDAAGRETEALQWGHWAIEHGFDLAAAESFYWISDDLWERTLAYSGKENSIR